MHPMIKEVGPKEFVSSGYIGDFRMSYDRLKNLLGEDAKENDQGWHLLLWNGAYITIYPEDYDNIEMLEQMKRNSRWHIGAGSEISNFGSRLSKIYNTIMHYILQDGIKGGHRTDEHDVIRIVLSAKNT